MGETDKNMVTSSLIQNRHFAMQIQDFSGLPIGATDIDGLIEYHDKCFVFLEAKFSDTEMKFGQRLALERLCDACQKAGKESLVIVCSHNTIDGDVDISRARVTEIRHFYKWINIDSGITVGQTVNIFLNKINEKE